jgi:hypothetical protein
MDDLNYTTEIQTPYTPLPYQRLIHNDTHRFKTIVAARRVGKSKLAVNELIKLAISRTDIPIKRFWYLAPYFYQAKQIAWNILLQDLPRSLWARQPNEGNLTIYLKNGAEISLKSADNPAGLEGTALGGLVIDEVSALTHWDFIWWNTLRPMLSDYESPAMFISKPRGFNHFFDLAKTGDHSQMIEGESSVKLDPEWITYRFATETNCKEHNGGYIKHAEIDAVKGSMPPEAFDQEYLGKFTKYTGLVHKYFDRAIHIIENQILPLEWQRGRGWDFGSNDPTASIRIATDSDNNWFIERVYKEKYKSITAVADAIKIEDIDIGKIAQGWGDPSGKQIISEFVYQGIPMKRAYKKENTDETNWIQFAVNRINERLIPRQGHTVYLPNGTKIENAPSLFILDRPDNYKLVRELETLSYDVSVTGVESTTIDDTLDREGHYDVWSALRYFAVSQGRNFTYGFADPNATDLKARVQTILDKSKQSLAPAQPQTPLTGQPASNQTVTTLPSPYNNTSADLKDPEARKKLEQAADLAAINQAKRDMGLL